ncbi:hypothetical protein GCM10027053_34690 [Intrasporangium mesophilum]
MQTHHATDRVNISDNLVVVQDVTSVLATDIRVAAALRDAVTYAG